MDGPTGRVVLSEPRGPVVRRFRRLALRILAQRIMPELLRAWRACAVRRRYIVVMGYPSTEGNIVEVVRALIGRYEGQIVWLDPPSTEYLQAKGIIDPTRQIARYRRHSIRSVVAYAHAEAVVYSHGFYGVPGTVRRKLTVNVWHGWGPKDSPTGLFPSRRAHGKPYDILICSGRVWGERCATLDGAQMDALQLLGNPRNDDLLRPASDECLADLGIDPGRPFVIWMPTYRRARGGRTMEAWTDSAQDAASDLSTRIMDIAKSLGTFDVQLAIKAHPLDADSRDVTGTSSLSDLDLERAGASLYSVLARSAGLISDLSSVWVDYLLLNRPIGYLVPDIDSYRAGRGIYPDNLMDWLPGPILESEKEFESFARSLRGQEYAYWESRRRVAAEIIGLSQCERCGERVASLICDRLATIRLSARARRADEAVSSDYPC